MLFCNRARRPFRACPLRSGSPGPSSQSAPVRLGSSLSSEHLDVPRCHRTGARPATTHSRFHWAMTAWQRQVEYSTP